MGLTQEAKDRRKQEKLDKEKEEPKSAEAINQKDFKYENHSGRMQILGIVAHELGHWALWHSLYAIVFSLLHIYLIFFAFSFAIKYTNMATAFGFAE